MDIISILMIVGGLFVEPKNYGLRGEKFFHEKGVWFSPITATSIVGYFFWKSRRHNKRG